MGDPRLYGARSPLAPGAWYPGTRGRDSLRGRAGRGWAVEQRRRCRGKRSRSMKRFARLYTALDETTSTSEKVAALAAYFSSTPPGDAAWALHFLIGRRPKRLISARKLRVWAAEEAQLPEWLVDESYQAVGDLAETITLLLPTSDVPTDLPLTYWVERLLRLRDEDD